MTDPSLRFLVDRAGRPRLPRVVVRITRHVALGRCPEEWLAVGRVCSPFLADRRPPPLTVTPDGHFPEAA